MKIKKLLLVVVTVAFGMAAGVILIAKHETGSEATPDAVIHEAILKPADVPPPMVAESPVLMPAMDSNIVETQPLPVANVQTNATPQKQKLKIPHVPRQKEEIQDPVAREALGYVGVDPDAEGYWFGAINNPDLPANERKDLIEDLNEDGLSDPHNPGPEDIPIIENRIALIEELAPDSMDQVNAAAFAEAYKDLVNMRGKLSAQ